MYKYEDNISNIKHGVFFTLKNFNSTHKCTVYMKTGIVFNYGTKKLEIKINAVECKENSVKSTAAMWKYDVLNTIKTLYRNRFGKVSHDAQQTVTAWEILIMIFFYYFSETV